MLQTLKGIVLRSRDYGESHQIVQVFSEQRGKISFLARGSKKPKSRFRAVTEPFVEGQFICFVGSGMPNLSQGDILNSHRLISTDLMKSCYGAYWFELIDRLFPEDEPNPGFYRFFQQMLTRLENEKNHEILTVMFELRIMEASGYRPVFHQCVHCQSKNSPYRFSASLGGFLCGECWEIDPEALQISDGVERILPLLQSVRIDRLGRINVKAETEEQLRKAIDQFMDTHLGIEFKARKMINQLKD